MKIAFMCREFPPARHGGTGSVTYEFADRLTKCGHSVYIISRYFSKPYSGQDTVGDLSEPYVARILEKVPLTVLDSAYYAYGAAKRTSRIVRDADIDIVEAPSHGGEAFFYSRNKNTPLVVRLQGFLSKVPLLFDQQSPTTDTTRSHERIFSSGVKGLLNSSNRALLWELEKKTLLNADLLICPSRSVREFILHEIPELREKEMVTIYNGIDRKEIDNSRQDDAQLRLKYGIPGDQKIICYAGRITRAKGVDTLLEAARIVCAQRTDVTFILIGTIIDASLAKSAENMRENVILTGRLTSLSEVYSLMNIAHVLVHPSTYEVFPTVILEGMALKKPIIASNIAPHLETVEPGNNGYLFEKGNSQDLARTILLLIDDESKQKVMGQHGFTTFNEKFSIERSIDKTIQAYSQLL